MNEFTRSVLNNLYADNIITNAEYNNYKNEISVSDVVDYLNDEKIKLNKLSREDFRPTNVTRLHWVGGQLIDLIKEKRNAVEAANYTSINSMYATLIHNGISKIALMESSKRLIRERFNFEEANEEPAQPPIEKVVEKKTKVIDENFHANCVDYFKSNLSYTYQDKLNKSKNITPELLNKFLEEELIIVRNLIKEKDQAVLEKNYSLSWDTLKIKTTNYFSFWVSLLLSDHTDIAAKPIDINISQCLLSYYEENNRDENCLNEYQNASQRRFEEKVLGVKYIKCFKFFNNILTEEEIKVYTGKVTEEDVENFLVGEEKRVKELSSIDDATARTLAPSYIDFSKANQDNIKTSSIHASACAAGFDVTTNDSIRYLNICYHLNHIYSNQSPKLVEEFGIESKQRLRSLFGFHTPGQYDKDYVTFAPTDHEKTGYKVMTDVKNVLSKAKYRVIQRQMLRRVIDGLLLMCKQNGSSRAELAMAKKFLESRIGEGLLSMMIGFGGEHIPTINKNQVYLNVVDEFKVEGAAIVGDDLIDRVVAALFPSIQETLSALPEPKAKPLVQEEEEIVEEIMVQQQRL